MCARRLALDMRVSMAGVVVLGALLTTHLLLPGASAQRIARRRDPSTSVAREITRRVARFPTFRERAPHGTWHVSPERAWSIRPTDSCHAALRSAGVPFEAIATRRSPIPAAVHVTGPVAGVTFRKMRRGAPLIVACELAARLPAIASVLARHRVREVDVLSAWRLEPTTSFHTMGLALDLHTFVRDDGTALVVERDFAIRPHAPTCADDPTSVGAAAAALHALACDLAASGVLSTVITPAYSAGHRDHLHVDARPDDPRLFVR